jgi:hypothetical protein
LENPKDFVEKYTDRNRKDRKLYNVQKQVASDAVLN